MSTPSFVSKPRPYLNPQNHERPSLDDQSLTDDLNQYSGAPTDPAWASSTLPQDLCFQRQFRTSQPVSEFIRRQPAHPDDRRRTRFDDVRWVGEQTRWTFAATAKSEPAASATPSSERFDAGRLARRSSDQSRLGYKR
jgi:hypothetical protein